MDLKLKNELDNLVVNGMLKSYESITLNENGEAIPEPGRTMREAEHLTLVFPSGEKIILGTFCSGSWENTSLYWAGPGGG